MRNIESFKMPAVPKADFMVRKIFKQKYLVLMSFPFVIWVLLFRYIPVWGWTMAFQNYKPGKGLFEQQWVGLDNFNRLFSDPKFYLVMRNTLAMSFLSLIFGFTLPIIFALFLNEIRKVSFKRTIQTVSYLPHFVSWVIVASLFSRVLSVDGGIVNEVMTVLHIFDKPVHFMAKGEWFWLIITAVDIWKELGWNSIIYLAAISSIDQNLYEAAIVDGAGRFRQMWSVTLPGIRPTVMVILIMSIGWLISIAFEKQFLMGNALVKDYSEVLDLYILNYGIGMGRFSYGTALGIFKSLVSIILLLFANQVARRIDQESVI